MPDSPTLPIPISLIVCQRVDINPATNGRTIVETLDHLSTPRWPLIWGRLCVYLELTGGHGRVPVEVRVVGSDESAPPLGTESLDVPMHDPLRTIHMFCIFYNLRFERADAYRVQAWCGEALLVERRLIVDQFTAPGPMPPESAP